MNILRNAQSKIVGISVNSFVSTETLKPIMINYTVTLNSKLCS